MEAPITPLLPQKHPRFTSEDLLWISGIALIVFILDLLTKIWAVSALRSAPPIDIIPGFLRLAYGENTGIAFGLFQNQGYILHILTPLAFIALIVIVYKQFAQMEMGLVYRLIFGLLFGGAMGNILNRLYCGYVIDFIDAYIGSYQWPTFNLADSALTVGEVILVYQLLFRREFSSAVPETENTSTSLETKAPPPQETHSHSQSE